jgi:ElaB/YqjD/DUF883 family membrane-anchored ribosome-binding protein
MADRNDATTRRETARASESTDPNVAAKQAANTVEDVRDKVQQTGRELSQKAQELGEQGKEIAAEYYQQGREKALAWERELEGHIREKPLQSLLIAGGIGLLLGLLWRRS